ncbi:electron transport protein [Neobacillus massiliamazoniensis]|uniref:Electron transporter n=1 Tax=Neobacillus massiliamazoniensis TaxID=1499688 RepID=A0A0U1NUU7_9BACI|nr:electron transport protein [Neobacillus massiliamazoniensis]CRK81804.1 electron transporter [Neobacillus massiliamazoniensis]
MRSGKWAIFIFVSCVITIVLTISLLKERNTEARRSDEICSQTQDTKLIDKPAYDLWGRMISQKEAEKLMKIEEGHALLDPKNGAIKIDENLLRLGKQAFREETFGNEVFLTDILGFVNGPITVEKLKKAIKELNGEGTTNLKVELAKTVTIGDKTFIKGEKVDTGLDVEKGSNKILGVPFIESEGKTKVGVSCIACHATVDPKTGTMMEGAINTDANFGLLLALSSNTTAYFARTEIESIKKFINESSKSVVTSEGKEEKLPIAEALEAKVDESVIKWPKGNFDITNDFKNNPAQIPDSFTLGDHPYSWSGFAMAGPFKGLSVINNGVNILGSDLTTLADASPALLGIDKEVYIGTILQNAANPKYRFDPNSGKKPSQFFAEIDPTPEAPGINEIVKLPTYPRPSLISPNGLLVSSPGTKVGEQNNGMAAYQNTLVPPKPPVKVEDKVFGLGERVFQRAGCISCHAGTYYTNNKIISVNEIKTEPTRANGLEKVGNYLVPSVIYSPDTPVPISGDARQLKVPTKQLDPEQIKLAFGSGISPGGYKVPSLLGLYWSAPYLHDGGVAVGPNLKTQLGIPGTLDKGILPDPVNSLYALIDKEMREKVIIANQPRKDVHVTGEGHEFWVDKSTGYSKNEQEALIKYLLTLE